MISGDTATTDFPHRHLLGIEGLTPAEITFLLDRSETYVEQNRQPDKKRSVLRGRTVINLFFEASTRTRTSFELAGKRLGGDVINMSISGSSIKKGETLVDTAMTLNAMHPDVLVVRHADSGAVKLAGLQVAICGDILHSRVARSNIHLLTTMGARVRLIAPKTLIPYAAERLGVEVFHDMAEGLKDCDIVMMLRLQQERMKSNYFPSVREYFTYFGLDYEMLAHAKPDALIMHPGPMNRGVEIDSEVADDFYRSVIREQVEMGVAVRMAALEILAHNLEPLAETNL